MQVNNLTFSKEELEVLQNKRFFEVKKSATQSLQRLFAELEDQLNPLILENKVLSSLLNGKRGRIFKGENYRDLPYVNLDYPGLFGKESVLAFRTLFWWGNGFSFTLHLAGNNWENYRESILRNLHILKGKGFYVCVNPNSPWEYHYEQSNYRALDESGSEEWIEEIRSRSFFKISRRMDLNEYKNLIPFGLETWKLLEKILNDQEPI